MGKKFKELKSKNEESQIAQLNKLRVRRVVIGRKSCRNCG